MISRSREKLQRIHDKFNDDANKQLVIYPCDVVNADRMKDILLDIYRIYGRIDILYANAGVSFRQLSLSQTFEQAVRDTFNININGVINTIMPLIDIKGVRQIAIMSSQAAYAPLISPIYGASKQCILSLGYDLRRLLAKDNIAVNMISPGPVKTPMLLGSYPRSVERGVSTVQAVDTIIRGLSRNQAEIVFPAMTGIFQYALSFLPLSIAETVGFYILQRQ
jgi:short-subunit dehydrogenase